MSWLYLAAFLLTANSTRTDPTGLVLCGERVRFDVTGAPHFTEKQIANSAAATRKGLEKWAATGRGKKMIAYFDSREFAVIVSESEDEDSAGRAPAPGIATLVASNNHTKLKTYSVILNPVFFHVPRGMTTLINEPATSADMMAAAWAGEMLHVWFYSQGVSLPHHPRADFQEAWRDVAEQLGVARLQHDDEDEGGRGRMVRYVRTNDE